MIRILLMCALLAGCAETRNEPAQRTGDEQEMTDETGGAIGAVIGCTIVIMTDSPRGACQ